MTRRDLSSPAFPIALPFRALFQVLGSNLFGSLWMFPPQRTFDMCRMSRIGRADRTVRDRRNADPRVWGTRRRHDPLPTVGLSIWLPELELRGRGADFESAREDLIDEVRQYVEEYLGDDRLRMAANHQPHVPWVVRAMLLDDGQLAEALFAQPPGSR